MVKVKLVDDLCFPVFKLITQWSDVFVCLGLGYGGASHQHWKSVGFDLGVGQPLHHLVRHQNSEIDFLALGLRYLYLLVDITVHLEHLLAVDYLLLSDLFYLVILIEVN